MNGNIDTIFLGKLQQALDLLDEIDDMIKQNPNDQQQIDFEISDYLHLIQNKDLSDLDTESLLKNLKELRLRRASHYNFYELSKAFSNNRNKLQYTSSRANLKEIIKNTRDSLNNEYNYRILDDESLHTLCKSADSKPEKKEKVRKTKYRITEAELSRMISEGMTTSEIATVFGCNPSLIPVYKRRYGITTRKYKKRKS